MSESLFLPSARVIPDCAVRLPGSKSISNRVLLLSALSENGCELVSLLEADDTRHMRGALAQLGVAVQSTASGSLKVAGCAGAFPQKKAELFLGNAGTAFRPLTAVLAVLGGDYVLSGVPRMHERPIGDLVDALRQAGARIDYLQKDGFPPLKTGAFQAASDRRITVRGDVSSQFLSALLMALPLTGSAWEIAVAGALVSRPYIDITLKLMAQFGVAVQNVGYRIFRLPEKAVYRAPARLAVEGDASGASYFLAAGFLDGAPVRVEGVGRDSIQGDTAFAHTLQTLGAQVEWGSDFIRVWRPQKQKIPAFDVDALAIPDAAMTLCPIALAADGTSRIRNIGSWRVKETDRIAAMKTELEKFGARVEDCADSITITPPEVLRAGVAVDTYDDHRMAMCFSLVSLLGVPVQINDPACVAKTFPGYFTVFAQMTAAE